MRISQFVISSDLKFSRNVFAFTQEGVAMLSSVLRSKRAVSVNIEIMRAFVRLRPRRESGSSSAKNGTRSLRLETISANNDNQKSAERER